MREKNRVSRRGALRLGAAAATLPLVHIRTAGAAGKLAIGFWDHWVPAGNEIMQKQVNAWAEKNKVEVTADFITGNGNKLMLTGAAEAQSKTGHDIYTFQNWDVHNQADTLANVDDVMKELIGRLGAVDATAQYLAKKQTGWVAVPTSSGTQAKPPCVRIGWFKNHGLDVQAMYPVRPEHTAAQDGWTWDALMKYAELAQKDGMTFAMGAGGSTNTDATDTHGALFRSFGATMIDANGKLQLDSPEMTQCLEFCQKLVKFYPDDAVSYDDASNNRALISGKTALIFNPPSAWAVAKRDAPAVAADCWTFSPPAGPKGRFVPTVTFFWGIWQFSRNQSAAKELLAFLMDRRQVEERDNVVEGYDLPPFAGLLDFPIWEKVEPPAGTVYNYPIRPWHNAQPSLAAFEADPDIAVQIYNRAVHNQMMARLKQGQSIKQVVAWAKDELEGFAR
ncbi:MAG TPA: extracellular solute-binding protein [Acetobacteraceae bacterium]|nr:extracellular solute-binding protein [Acetobacteraceae bacterium]